MSKPDIVLLIGRCTALWPFIEHDLAVCLALLLRSHTSAGLAVFSAIKSSRTQQDAMLAAAEAVLDESDAHLVDACLHIVRTTERERNDIVHGQWGSLEGVPDGLVWIEAKHHAPHNAKALLDPVEFQKGGHLPLEQKMFVYRAADLEGAAEHMLQTRWVTFHLMVYLRTLNEPEVERARVRETLSSLPLVVEAQSRLDGQRNRKPTPRQ